MIFAETIGLWFVNSKLVIPAERKFASNIIYQAAVLSFIFTFITTPYMACIIAHENMNVYAYVSIIETALKLLIVFILKWVLFDKLIMYGILLAAVALINTAIYRTYCKKKYVECKFKFIWNPSLFKELAILLMKKGFHVDFLTFVSPPHTSKEAENKVRSLIKQITLNGKLEKPILYTCKFTDIQHEISHISNHSYQITIMRRYFFRIAQHLVKTQHYDAMATGESLGQVASQTIESMTTISQVLDNIVVLRPLLTSLIFTLYLFLSFTSAEVRCLTKKTVVIKQIAQIDYPFVVRV